MIVVDQALISKLKELKTTYSTEALKKPQEKTEFEYGRHCGVIEGFEKVEELIKQLIEGEDRDGSSKKSSHGRSGPYTA